MIFSPTRLEDAYLIDGSERDRAWPDLERLSRWPPAASVSIICVFNDPEVRRGCLDRSIAEHRDEAAVEYLPIDNVDGSFATAGAALNHGASLASHDYLVFVHQDVYLHSLAALERPRARSPTTEDRRSSARSASTRRAADRGPRSATG